MKNRSISIHVTESDKFYLVKFSTPLLRDRAKKIPGRKYDPDKRIWYWKKSTEAFNELKKEFKDDANSFVIKAPENEQVAQTYDSDNNEADAQISVIDEILEIKSEIKDFKNTDIEQTNSIKILSNQILEQFSLINERITEKPKQQKIQNTVTISDLFAWGLDSSQVNLEKDIGFKLNFDDLIGCLNMLHQKLEERMISLLDIPASKKFGYDLYKLIQEAGEHDVIEKYHVNNLHSFRVYRNICGHGINGKPISQAKQKVVASIAILALSLSWSRVAR